MKENAGYKYRRREVDRCLTTTMKVAVTAERTTSRRRKMTRSTATAVRARRQHVVYVPAPGDKKENAGYKYRRRETDV